jgi:hypothetical protein
MKVTTVLEIERSSLGDVIKVDPRSGAVDLIVKLEGENSTTLQLPLGAVIKLINTLIAAHTAAVEMKVKA